MELEQKGVEVMWAQHPLLLVIDEQIFKSFQTWILETLPETLGVESQERNNSPSNQSIGADETRVD